MMQSMTSTPRVFDLAWDDAFWVEKADTAWQRGLRWQQAWWRATRLGLPPGPFSAKQPDRLVASTLARDAPTDANFLTSEVAAAATRRLSARGGGLVKEDRLRRNLLSSQPMCFNLFGQFQDEEHRQTLLPWVQGLRPNAELVTRVEIEWAPPSEEHFRGGSAFDAFVEYETTGRTLGFLGIECKYHEDLPKSDVPSVRNVYKAFTVESQRWRDGAADRLDRRGFRQFWLNTLLVQSLLEKDSSYSEGTCVIMACEADRSARVAFETVQSELAAAHELSWQSWESITTAIAGHDDWRKLFIERYLDFAPVDHLLGPTDPRHREHGAT